MPLMTNPNVNVRQRKQLSVPRLRNRSLPRLRMGNHQPQPDSRGEDHEEPIAKELHVEKPSKSRSPRVRRRSYSLPRRLLLARSDESSDARQESIDTLLESNSTVDAEEAPSRQAQKVSFLKELVDKEFEFEELDYDATQFWYQQPDYTRFKKDRILTSFDYQASVQGKSTFNHEEHSIRGLEMVIHPRYGTRISLDKKDLQKALQKEEAHQKETGKFPNLDRFQVVSQRYTKDAQNRAYALGAEDAKDVQQGKDHGGKSWISRKLKFGAPPERGVRRHRSMDSEL